MSVVIKRSPSLFNVRAAITDGTLQPKPTMSGTKAFPGKPSARIKRSIINAPRAIKPTSSKNDSDKNNAAITGIKLATNCTPPPIPSAIKAVSQSGALMLCNNQRGVSTNNAPALISKKSINALPTLIANINNKYITPIKIGKAKIRFKTMSSMYSLRVLVFFSLKVMAFWQT